MGNQASAKRSSQKIEMEILQPISVPKKFMQFMNRKPGVTVATQTEYIEEKKGLHLKSRKKRDAVKKDFANKKRLDDLLEEISKAGRRLADLLEEMHHMKHSNECILIPGIQSDEITNGCYKDNPRTYSSFRNFNSRYSKKMESEIEFPLTPVHRKIRKLKNRKSAITTSTIQKKCMEIKRKIEQELFAMDFKDTECMEENLDSLLKLEKMINSVCDDLLDMLYQEHLEKHYELNSSGSNQERLSL